MGKLICILEDDPGIRDVLELLFMEEGYQVESYFTIHDFFSKKPSAVIYHKHNTRNLSKNETLKILAFFWRNSVHIGELIFARPCRSTPEK